MNTRTNFSGRRFFLKASGAAVIFALKPHLNQNHDFRIFNEANAWVFAALSLVVSLARQFAGKSDGGLGAMLSSIQQLTEHNIQLSQQILINVAKVQESIYALPEKFRELLIENAQFKIRENTSAIQINLKIVQSELASDPKSINTKAVRERLTEITKLGINLSGAQDVPYGIGPMGAICRQNWISFGTACRMRRPLQI